MGLDVSHVDCTQQSFHDPIRKSRMVDNLCARVKYYSTRQTVSASELVRQVGR